MAKSQCLLAIRFITKEAEYSFGPPQAAGRSWKENKEGNQPLDDLCILLLTAGKAKFTLQNYLQVFLLPGMQDQNKAGR